MHCYRVSQAGPTEPEEEEEVDLGPTFCSVVQLQNYKLLLRCHFCCWTAPLPLKKSFFLEWDLDLKTWTVLYFFWEKNCRKILCATLDCQIYILRRREFWLSKSENTKILCQKDKSLMNITFPGCLWLYRFCAKVFTQTSSWLSPWLPCCQRSPRSNPCSYFRLTHKVHPSQKIYGIKMKVNGDRIHYCQF